MDHTPRQRYHSRRKAIAEQRRRITMLALLGAFGLAFLLGWLAWPRSASAPEQAPTTAQPEPTSAALTADAALPQYDTRAAQFFHDQRLTYAPDFYVPAVQAFLEQQPGILDDFTAPVGKQIETFAEIIVGQCLYYSVNPQVVLALLESQGGLVSNPAPTLQQQEWVLGYRTKDAKPEEDKLKGLTAQIRWAVRQLLYARRDYPTLVPLTFVDGTSMAVPADWQLGQYAIARALAPATTADKLDQRMQAFLDTFTRLFGDPRPAPENMPAVAEPFLVSPLPHPSRITSFFDHDGPFLSRNGGTFSYWGRNETDLSYDGHDGWDYAIAPPDPALAAATGTVVFAGNADDNCATTAVVIDHGNGYRTLYWHLSSIGVVLGQHVAAGDEVGITGASGCAFGPHLHLGVQYLGRATDPYGYCGSVADPWNENPGGTMSVWLWQDRPSPCGPPPHDAVVVDTDSPGFAKSGVWQQASLGYAGGALYARSVGLPPTAVPSTPLASAVAAPESEPTSTATYTPPLVAGRYRVYAYIPYVLNNLDDAIGVTYRIRHSAGEAQVTVDMQQYANEWIDLGAYDFAPGTAEIRFDNRASTSDQSVWADAIMWRPE